MEFGMYRLKKIRVARRGVFLVAVQDRSGCWSNEEEIDMAVLRVTEDGRGVSVFIPRRDVDRLVRCLGSRRRCLERWGR